MMHDGGNPYPHALLPLQSHAGRADASWSAPARKVHAARDGENLNARYLWDDPIGAFPAMSDPLEELKKRYSALETDELFAIVHNDSHQYRPEAVRIAREELAGRGIPQEGTVELRYNAERGRREGIADEGAPLSTGLMLFCLLSSGMLLGMPALVVYAVLENRGRKRAAREALVCFGIGIGIWISLGLACGILYAA